MHLKEPLGELNRRKRSSILVSQLLIHLKDYLLPLSAVVLHFPIEYLLRFVGLIIIRNLPLLF
jgi:hypothetical protein